MIVILIVLFVIVIFFLITNIIWCMCLAKWEGRLNEMNAERISREICLMEWQKRLEKREAKK